MTNINDALDNELIDKEQTTPEVEAVEVPENTERKSISLDDALAQAFAKHSTEEADDKPKGALPNTPPVAVTPGKVIDPLTGREQEPMKAPVGWTPLLRETKWNSIDPVVQKFIIDRERDMSQTISKTAEDRKLANEVKDAFAPYESTIRQFNMTGVQLAKDLMTQWHALQTGNDVVKAQVFAGLLNHFKPNPQILQQVLAGQQPAYQAPQAAPDVQALVQAEIAKRETAVMQQTVGSDISRFSADPSNEFFEDVKERMGRILNADLVDAPTMPELLKKAYDLACSQHPEISQIIASRTPAAPAAVQKTVKPVGSVKPSLNGGGRSAPAARKMSLDDAVNEAFRRHSA